MTVPNTLQGIRPLLARTSPTDPWVVEPTGVSRQAVVREAQAVDRSVLRAQPKWAKAFLVAIQPQAKTDRVDSRGLALDSLSAALRPFRVQSEAMERIDQLLAALAEIPGIGSVTATAVACLMNKQFDHPGQFVTSIGLDTRVRESGQRQGRRALTKQGDAELRRLLYLCAQANVRSRDPENPFKRQYEREKAKGLPTTGH